MIRRFVWFGTLLAVAVITTFLQIDRQAALTPALTSMVPAAFRNFAQPIVAARATDGDDTAQALVEAQRLVRRRPIPAEHLTVLAVAQTRAGQAEQAGLTIQIAGQRGWREPLAQEAVLRLALAAGDKPEAARRYAALFLRASTPNDLLQALGSEVLDEANGPGRRTLTDIISGTDRWNSVFLRRGAQVMPLDAFSEIAVATIARGTRYDCDILAQTIKAVGQRDQQAAVRLISATRPQCPQSSADQSVRMMPEKSEPALSLAKAS